MQRPRRRRGRGQEEQASLKMVAAVGPAAPLPSTPALLRRSRLAGTPSNSRPALVCLSVLWVLAVLGRAGAQVCTYDSRMGATFDLQALVRQGDMPSYSVTDGDIPCTPEVEQNFTYLFNVCNQVSGEIPVGCDRYAGKASALQMDRRPNADPANSCHRAGSFEATTAAEAESYFSLLDPTDPSKGVSILYTGEHCQHNDQGQPDPNVIRKFKLQFECADLPVAVPVHALEFHHCEYTIAVPSVFGCPVECPVVNKHLCNGRGHCAYDQDLRQARCFCDQGFTGAGCAQTLQEAQSLVTRASAVTGVLAALFVLVVVLLGATFVMFKQVKAYKEDATNYIMLAGVDIDEGGV